jgi:hypothetical protein
LLYGLLNHPHVLQTGVRRMLHRAVDFIAHAWSATRQTGRHALPASGRNPALQIIRPA